MQVDWLRAQHALEREENMEEGKEGRKRWGLGQALCPEKRGMDDML